MVVLIVRQPWWTCKDIGLRYGVQACTVRGWLKLARRRGAGPDPHQVRLVRRGRWCRVLMLKDSYVDKLFEASHPESFYLLKKLLKK
ncbi:MAG: hypothetical protein Q8P44_09515 [Dehalococcoidia bacterium]|nr:hypothetical protein [Dehalococcoidia bacterium]